jgi:hypothetical protein
VANNLSQRRLIVAAGDIMFFSLRQQRDFAAAPLPRIEDRTTIVRALKVVGGRMKSMLFILVAHLHAGGTQTVGAHSSLEQCRGALKAAVTNVAAEYTCEATPVEGTWSRKDSRIVMVRE